MKSVLDALNKFLNGEIDSEQLLAELSFNISECFNSLSDEDLKQKLAALKKELYKSDGDFVKIKQMAKVCYEELKKLLDLDDESEDESDFGKKRLPSNSGAKRQKPPKRAVKPLPTAFMTEPFWQTTLKPKKKRKTKPTKRKNLLEIRYRKS